jgi:hypothetical protein
MHRPKVRPPSAPCGARRIALRTALGTALCALPLAGCYRYAPLPAAAAPAPGAEVRLYLTPDGTTRVAPTLGPQTTVVTGRTEQGPDRPGPDRQPQSDGVRLLVSSTTKAYGGTTPWVGERVTIPLDAIARGERRVVDRRRSALAGGGVALAAAAGYAVLRAVRGGGAGAGGDPPPPTP